MTSNDQRNIHETTEQRYTRLRQQNFDPKDGVTFTVHPFRGKYILKTLRLVPEGQIELTSFTCKDLFKQLFCDYPLILEKLQHIQDPFPYPEHPHTRHFIFMHDKNPKQHQEPFILIELLNINVPGEGIDRRGVYFKDLNHFLRRFLNPLQDP